MKNSILNLGKALNKAEQKEINGGGPSENCRQHMLCMRVCLNDPTVTSEFCELNECSRSHC